MSAAVGDDDASSLSLPSGADGSRNAISDVGLAIMANPERLVDDLAAITSVTLDDDDDDDPDAPMIRRSDDGIASALPLHDDNGDDAVNVVDDDDELMVPASGLYGYQQQPSMPTAMTSIGRGVPTTTTTTSEMHDADASLPLFPSFAAATTGGASALARTGVHAESSESDSHARSPPATTMPSGGPFHNLPPIREEYNESRQDATNQEEAYEQSGRRSDSDRRSPLHSETRAPDTSARRAQSPERRASTSTSDQQRRDRVTAADERDVESQSGDGARRPPPQRRRKQREQTYAEFQEDIRRKVKEQEDMEKREMILLFWEKQNVEKIKVPSKFLGPDALSCDLQEMRWWYYKLIRDTRISDEVTSVKQNIVQGTRMLLFLNNTINNPLNLRLDSNFPNELANTLNTKLDRHLRDHIKSKCGVGGPKPNPIKHIAQGLVETAWNYHRNQVAMENNDAKARKDVPPPPSVNATGGSAPNAFSAYNMFAALNGHGAQRASQSYAAAPGAPTGSWAQPPPPAPPPPVPANAPPHVRQQQYQQFLRWQETQRRFYEQQLELPQQQRRHQPHVATPPHFPASAPPPPSRHPPVNASHVRHAPPPPPSRNPLARTNMYQRPVPAAPQWRTPAQRPPAPPPTFQSNRRPLRNALRRMDSTQRRTPLPTHLRPPQRPSRPTTASPSALRGDMSLAAAAKAIQAQLRDGGAPGPAGVGLPPPPSAPRNSAAPSVARRTLPGRFAPSTRKPATPQVGTSGAINARPTPHIINARRAPANAFTKKSSRPLEQQRQSTQTTRLNGPRQVTRATPAVPVAGAAPPALPTVPSHLARRRQQVAVPTVVDRSNSSRSSTTLSQQPAPPTANAPSHNVATQQHPTPFPMTRKTDDGRTALRQVDVRAQRTVAGRKKTYDDLMSDLEQAYADDASGDDELHGSLDDLSRADVVMPNMSTDDKLSEAISLMEGFMGGGGDSGNDGGAAGAHHQPVSVYDLDDLLQGSEATHTEDSTAASGPPIMSLSDIQRMKKNRRNNYNNNSDRQPDRSASDGSRETTRRKSGSVGPRRRRRLARSSSGATDERLGGASSPEPEPIKDRGRSVPRATPPSSPITTPPHTPTFDVVVGKTKNGLGKLTFSSTKKSP